MSPEAECRHLSAPALIKRENAAETPSRTTSGGWSCAVPSGVEPLEVLGRPGVEQALATAWRVGRGRSLLWTGLILAILLLACESKPCTSTVTVAGQSATGSGADKPAALHAACQTHCLEHDALLDGKYRVWKAAGGQSSGDKGKDVEGVGPLRRILDSCRERCKNSVEPAAVSYRDCGS